MGEESTILWGRKRVTAALAIGLGVVIGGVLFVTVRAAYQAVAESPQHAVLVEAERLLEDYRREHGHYPESLKDLPFEFRGDGQPETLELFVYQSDGEHFALVTQSVVTGEEMKACR